VPGNSDSTDFAKEWKGGYKVLTAERPSGLAATNRNPKSGTSALEAQAAANTINRVTKTDRTVAPRCAHHVPSRAEKVER
jgi:hypothetical protein